MFEFAAALSFVFAIIIGFVSGYHREGGGGAVAFFLTYGILFVVIAVVFVVFS